MTNIKAPDGSTDQIKLRGTGNASREFLYAEDAAEGILLAVERYNGSEPINLGTGEEITIRDLACLIADLTGFSGEIRFDPSKPDGQPTRRLDNTSAKVHF